MKDCADRYNGVEKRLGEFLMCLTRASAKRTSDSFKYERIRNRAKYVSDINSLATFLRNDVKA